MCLCSYVWWGGVRVGDDSLGDLAHVHKKQGEGQNPADIMAREVQPGVVVDLHLRTLTAPTCTYKYTKTLA